MSLRDHILAADDRRYDTVKVKEWDCVVRLCSISAADHQAWEEIRKQHTGNVTMQACELLVRAIVDEKGERVFKDDDSVALSKKSISVLLDLFDKATALNSTSQEEHRGNSSSDQADVSLSS